MKHLFSIVLFVLITYCCFSDSKSLSHHDNDGPVSGWISNKTAWTYTDLKSYLDFNIARNELLVVTRASASEGAAKFNITIPGNMVVGVFHPLIALRLLNASVDAGIEAPIRYYLTENKEDNTSTLTYRQPSVIFAPYIAALKDETAIKELTEVAKNLDELFNLIFVGTVAGKH